MKTKWLWLISGILILLLLGVLILNLQWSKRPFVSKLITIPAGIGASRIGSILERDGIVRDSRIFRIIATIRGVTTRLRAGVYKLNNKMTISEILHKLTKGEVSGKIVTIFEGYTLNQIADLLSNQGLVERERFLYLCHDPSFFRNLYPIPAESLNGYLFPATYLINDGIKEEEIIELMVERFKKSITEKDRMRAKELGFGIHEILTLASLIEWEAKIPSEKAIISAVFHNRLKEGKSLESCASVIYAIGRHKVNLSYEDLKTQSPYNTYLNPGLPPGPICNPGRASIEAALNPASVDYLYFVSNGDGTHTFSRTYQEHTNAKRKNGRCLLDSKIRKYKG